MVAALVRAALVWAVLGSAAWGLVALVSAALVRAGWWGGAVEFPACRTATVVPPMLTLPVRAGPGFGATTRRTVVAPAPDEGSGESQVSEGRVVQPHPPGATRFSSTAPLPAPMSTDRGDTS